MNKKYNQYAISGDNVIVQYNNCDDVFLCDREDWLLAMIHNWVRGKDLYPVARMPQGKNIRFHQLVMKVKQGNYVDHIDRNRANNKRNNLREVNPKESAKNKSMKSDNTSGCCGVSFDKRKNKWRAYYTINKKQIFIGYFNTLEEAMTDRIKKADSIGLFTDVNVAFLLELEKEGKV